MKIPLKMTEAEVISEINRIVSLLANSFKFGYLDAEDIKQTAWIFAIEGLERYDETRSFDSFIYTHVKNRLINFKRDKFKRASSCCKLCQNRLVNDTLHKDKKHCKNHLRWLKRNSTKQNLMSPTSIYNISSANLAADPGIIYDDLEILNKIESKLDKKNKVIYNKIMSNKFVSQKSYDKLVASAKEIVCQTENQP